MTDMAFPEGSAAVMPQPISVAADVPTEIPQAAISPLPAGHREREVLRVEIAKLTLTKGDVLVVRARFTEQAEVEMIFDQLREVLPTGTPFIVLDRDVEISVVPGDAAKRALEGAPASE